MMLVLETKGLGMKNDKTITYFKFLCDTVADLPLLTIFDDRNIVLAQGCEALVIDPKSSYKMKSDGTWIIQDVGNDYYSKTEIDNLLNEKQDLLVLGTNFDSEPTSGSDYPVRSGGVVNYTFGAAAVRIQSGDDLNTYVDPGAYRCESNSIAASLVNCPTSNGFRMEVKSTIASSATGYQLQFIYPNNANGEFFMRRRGSAGSGTWSSWFKFSGTAV